MEKSFIKTNEINGYEIRSIITDKVWKQNCYLITHKETGEQILVDPGANENFLINLVEENGSGILSYILLTHAHFDHIGAVHVISNKFSLPCYVHKSDFRLLRQAPMYSLRFGGKPVSFPKDVITFDQDLKLMFGDNFLKVYLTPGHTPGSVCYGLNGFVFTGDTLLNNYVGRVDLPGSSAIMLQNSVDYLLNDLTEDTVIFGGHGKSWNIKDALIWWKDAKMSLPQHNMFTH